MSSFAETALRDFGTGALQSKVFSTSAPLVPLVLMVTLSVLCFMPPELCTESPIIEGVAASGTAIGSSRGEVSHAAQLPSLLMCLIATFFFHGLLCSVEVGTALVLEVDFNWQTSKIGIALCTVFLGSVLPTLLFSAWIEAPKRLPARSWRAAMVVFGLPLSASLLLLREALWLPPLVVVMISDAFVFGSGLAVGSFVLARYRNLAISGSTVWTVGNLSVLMALCESCSRLVAGPLSRFAIGSGGLAVFSITQFSSSVVVSLTGVATLFLLNHGSD
eukprot:NODE_17296_length_951_cov_3.212379.p1 GENE.NODE_17296_length_951_cov_3.212379~~NODE_17296_length_951_cov_3.212379.p1  ORF type:complete len:300 (+),score=28.97 NODE_17296_length_951_cov_3.212379:74-901(+)